MKAWTTRCALASALLVLAAGARGAEYVDAYVWSAPELGATLPEMAGDAPSPKNWAGKPSFGVAFSGGGTRAAAAALGQLRALTTLGWYSRVKYVSSSSGGTWGTLPFTYLPAAFEEGEYLGALKAPGELTDADFREQPRYSLAHVIANARLTAPLVRGWLALQGGESYASALGDVFLAPYGLNDPQRSFAWSAQHAADAVRRNAGCFAEADPAQVYRGTTGARHACDAGAAQPATGETASSLAPDDFYLPRAGRPFHIVNASVLAQRTLLSRRLEQAWMFPLEMTPYYTGVLVPRRHVFPNGQTHDIGGALVESFAYDAWPPVRVTGDAAAWPPPAPGVLETYRAQLRGPNSRFTLRDLLAASGASPQQVTSAVGFRNLGLPEFNHWALEHDAQGRATNAVARPLQHELAHGDAGHVDNLSLPPLLERGVRHAIVFINGLYPFRAMQGERGYPIDERSLSHQLRDYFDPQHLDHVIRGVAGESRAACTRSTDAAARCALQDVYDTFSQAQREGRPLVHCSAYDINTANSRYRLAGSAEPVRICWSYLDGSEQWLAALNPALDRELRLDLRLRRKPHQHFPHYHTFFENPELREAVQYKPQQVAALSQLTGWALCASAAQIAQAFAELRLPQPACAGVPARP